MFPEDNYWHADVSGLPVHPRSDDYIASIGWDRYVHADFGSGLWEGSTIGIPWTEVDGDQPTVPISFYYEDESDPGPYPIPPNAPIQGGPDSDGDRHVIVVETGSCTLYEVYDAWPQPNGSWESGSGAVWDLSSNAFRPAGWTSSNAAGTPLLPGLVQYDEVANDTLDHAIHVTVPATQKSYVWPATHWASYSTNPNLPPMGLWLRLRADFDTSGYSPQVQVIMEAMKKHGVIVTDNGSPWFLSGVPDERWDNDMLRQLRDIKGHDFEALDVSSLMVSPDSGQVNQ